MRRTGSPGSARPASIRATPARPARPDPLPPRRRLRGHRGPPDHAGPRAPGDGGLRRRVGLVRPGRGGARPRTRDARRRDARRAHRGRALARLQRGRAAGGNALRAAVLGVNDGLVSNASLVMGVAGAGVASKRHPDHRRRRPDRRRLLDGDGRVDLRPVEPRAQRAGARDRADAHRVRPGGRSGPSWRSSTSRRASSLARRGTSRTR